MKQDLREVLGKQLIILDGGMGTMLQAAGLPAGVMGETWNLDHPEKVYEIQKKYAAAGCDILTANTFGANRLKYARSGRSAAETVQAGIRIARRALEDGRPAEVRESRGPGWTALDIGPTGQLLEPFGDLEQEECEEIFAEMVRASLETKADDGSPAGPDLVLIETMIDLAEARAAAAAARKNSDLPVIATVTLEQNGRMLLGTDIPELVSGLEDAGVDALGLNCGFGPEIMLEHLKVIRGLTELPVVITPNAGLPRRENGRTVYDVHPDDFAEVIGRIREAGADVIGGCCGTTPEHMEAAVKRLFF